MKDSTILPIVKGLVGPVTIGPTEPTGADVDYYVLDIPDPKRLKPYTVEAEDIMEALNMTFSEGNVFKALWRSCAARELGILKPGMDPDGIYDGEKIEYYGKRISVQRKRQKAKKAKKK